MVVCLVSATVVLVIYYTVLSIEPGGKCRLLLQLCIEYRVLSDPAALLSWWLHRLSQRDCSAAAEAGQGADSPRPLSAELRAHLAREPGCGSSESELRQLAAEWPAGRRAAVQTALHHDAKALEERLRDELDKRKKYQVRAPQMMCSPGGESVVRRNY